MKIFQVLLSFAFLATLSCTTAKKSAQTAKKCACSNLAQTEPVLHWYPEPRRVLEGYTLTLPTDYNVYSIDSAELSEFFMQINSKAPEMRFNTIIPLPEPLGCQAFEIAKGPNSKLPEDRGGMLLSLSGTDMQSRQAIFKAMYNGEKMNIDIKMNNTFYSVTPIKYNKTIYYIVYLGKEIGTSKTPAIKTINGLTSPVYDK
jgi:hypothetical protein